ncbi:sugar efflux transporter [Serratia sp. M24T3]|uniref:sugar efflux transporter n=1 Tax=Serratia sp. M24T3 TaxID=932213 RepID=UPI00025BAF3A|nr:sugar efflux transporter [Serratia sp. M24T3]EIC85325.1 sugar efflux transporter [Serratia sp. M24T3]
MELEQQAEGSNQLVSAAFMATVLLLGISGAFQWPVLSLFLTRNTGATPMMVGAFYTVNAIAGIGMSQLIARRSDATGNRRNLIIACCSIAVVNALLFAYNRHYWVLISLGVLMSAVSIAAMPQVFALARQYADQTGGEVVKFTTRMRAQISLSWIVAPPLAFFTLAHFGFTVLYLIVASLFALALLLVVALLPSLPALPVQAIETGPNVSKTKDRDVWWLFAAFALLWAGDAMYLIDMPLYISSLSHVAAGFAGWLLGVGAGFEVLIVLFSVTLIHRFGKRPLLLVGVLSAVVFYAGMALVVSPQALMAIQIFNALFIGIVGGMGMLYMQDLLPAAPGSASTLYSNSVSTGAIIAGLLQGLVSENLGHQPVYWVAMVISLLALGMALRVKKA